MAQIIYRAQIQRFVDRICSVRLYVYDNCIFSFLSLYSLAYISLRFVPCTCNILFPTYNDSSLSSWYQSRFSDFFLFLFRCSHGLGIIATVQLIFSGERHCLLFISYLCKPKNEVIGHLEVDLVEMITPVCSRYPKTLPRVILRC